MNKQTVKKRMTLVILFLLASVFIVWYLAPNTQQRGYNALTTEANYATKEELKTHVQNLNFVRHSTTDKKKARDYIREQLVKSGYKVIEQRSGKYVNLIVQNQSHYLDGYSLVAAHYDSVKGTAGADDNNSATSALIEIIQHNTNKDIRFAFFDGEEEQFIGSRYYVDNLQELPKQVIILETIGYTNNATNTQKVPKSFSIYFRPLYNRLVKDEFRGNFTAFVCAPATVNTCSKLESIASDLDLEAFTIRIPTIASVRKIFNDMFRSDHTPFLERGVPAIMITDTANFRNTNYHKTTDTPDTLDYVFLAKQTNLIINLLNSGIN